MSEAPRAGAPEPAADLEARVLEVVRGLAAEAGGSRAVLAVRPEASLERDLGLGSLERVELLLRLERVFGRALDDSFLILDSAAELARALEALPGAEPLRVPERGPAVAEAGAPIAARTLHEALWLRAQADPERAHVFLREEDGREHVVSYARLLDEARRIAAGLRERGVRRGDAVALMLPTGLDFLAAFQGTLLAGAVPVPIYPPLRLDRLAEYAARQAAILKDASVVALLTVPRAMPIAAMLRPRVPSLAQVVSARELAAAAPAPGPPQGAGPDPAFIQYTSGSTGQPKGVLLTHDNLLANIRAIGRGVELRPTDVGVSWLPLYHDMGLIGSWLFCLVEGIPIDVQSPTSFLARPERWLWAIHRRRGTLSGAPNFAYELCVRKVPDAALEGLDLSSWRCALNGAEPVHPDTLERFARRFAPRGFRREALMPVYGLAECSVALCFPPPGRGPRVDRVAREPFERERRAVPAPEGDARALRFVSEGRALPEHEVRLVDEAGHEVAERVVGRLLFRGPSATSGYFRNPEATAALTRADGWLDSGDLAYRAGGEIHVCGRAKDLIIKAGRNLVPQELEELAGRVEGVRKGCVIAFGVEHRELGTESLVLVAETRAEAKEERDRIAAAVTERLADAVGLPPDAVLLVPPGALPKTSSGKVRRAAARELYLAGELGRRPRGSLLARGQLALRAAAHEAAARLGLLPRMLFALYLALVVLAAAPLVWLLALLAPSRRAVFALQRLACRALLRAAFCRLEATGLERLPAGGALVLACNHASYADVPALVALLPRDFLIVAKKEVRRWPLVGTFVRRCGHLAVERWEARASVADAGRVARAVDEASAVLVFPEGTFVAATGLRPFRLGAFKTAVEAGIPVVPLALSGTRRVLRGDALLPRPATIRLWVGEPIVASDPGFRGMLALRDRVAEAIAAECGEPRLDLLSAGPPAP
jgi:1-acyl-sn-glycerol-3-phosphate acyltransferase